MNSRSAYTFVFLLAMSMFWTFESRSAAQEQTIDTNERVVSADQWSQFFRTAIKSSVLDYKSPPILSDRSEKPVAKDLRKAAETAEKMEKSFSERQKAYLKKESKGSSYLSGGIDSGGGALVIKNGTATLLDFYNFSFWSFPQRGHTLEIPTDCPIETIRVFDTPLAGYLDNLLTPILDGEQTRTLESALTSLQVSFIDKEFTQAALDPKAYVPPSKSLQLVPAALYIKSQGVLISLPTFNQLSLKNQLGLLIHEVLRQISIGFELAISDKDLQELTSIITQKKAGELLEKEKYEFQKYELPPNLFNGIFSSYVLRANLNYACARMEELGQTLGQGCESLATTDIREIYKILPSIRDEVLSNLPNSNLRPTQAWKNVLTFYESLRKARVHRISSSVNSELKLFSKRSRALQKTTRRNNMCSGFLMALDAEGLIKDPTGPHLKSKVWHFK